MTTKLPVALLQVATQSVAVIQYGQCLSAWYLDVTDSNLNHSSRFGLVGLLVVEDGDTARSGVALWIDDCVAFIG